MTIEIVHRLLHILLVTLTGFLSLTAVAGGIGLLSEMNVPPMEMLSGSPFNSYVIPGLALLIFVGGSAFLATVLLTRRHQHALNVTFMSAMFIIVFETVEIYTIGAPEGIARILQVVYIVIGVLIASVSWTKKQLYSK